MTESTPQTETDRNGPVLGLQWAIKRSFQDYLASMPDGRGSVSDGASVSPDAHDVMVFEPHEALTDASTLAFRGDIRFAAHNGLLFVRVAHPRITLDSERAELTVDDPYTTDGTGERLTLVTLKLTELESKGDLRRWAGTDVKVTAAGSVLFNEVYPEGTEFEDLDITLPGGAA